METTKEIELVKVQVSKALQAVESIVVNNDESMLEAGDMRKRVKTVGKMIKERKEAITKPINESLKSIRALFLPFESDYEKAEEIITSKMLSYQKSVDDERIRIEAENLKKIKEQGNASIVDHSAPKIQLEIAPEVIKKSEDFHTRTNKVFKVVDKSKLPIKFLIADEVAIRKAMYAGIQLEGVEYSEEKVIV